MCLENTYEQGGLRSLTPAVPTSEPVQESPMREVSVARKASQEPEFAPVIEESTTITDTKAAKADATGASVPEELEAVRLTDIKGTKPDSPREWSSGELRDGH